MSRFRLIEGVFRDSCLKCGYEEIRTPTLEYLHLFTSAGTLTPSMLGRVYSFLDWDGWSGERVVLRPDGTIPVARLYIDTMAEKELARLFYITNVFTFETTGEETRERWQFGTELIGVSSTVADVELIALAMEVLRGLGFKGIELRLSHAGLIRVLLAGLGLSSREQTLIFNQMLDGDISALARVKPARPGLEMGLTSILDMKGKSAGFLKNIKALFPNDLPDLKAPLDDFINIVSLLDALGFEYQIDLASGRGFEYYTGVIFQFFNDEEKIGGGGRYDALIPLVGGKDVPASGFALYLDPLMNMVKPETFMNPLPQRVLITAKPQAVKEGFNVANYLRQAGYLAELNLVGQVPADLKWTLDVRRKAPPFVLTDRLNHRKFELETVEEVAVRLRGGK
jgi:histidyl-tRNA synthetase